MDGRISSHLNQSLLISQLNKEEKLFRFRETFHRNGRLAGRGSADDKAGVMTILNAYDALVKTGVALKHNIKFFFEGEEELGSTHLDEIFKKHKEKLQTDLWVIVDGPRMFQEKK